MELSSKMLSVVTATRNRLSYLRGCVASVAAQEDASVEHIVMDGGSEDGTAEYLAGRPGRISHWASQADGGMYPAINAGLRVARGAIRCYLNDDDRLTPWAAKYVLRTFAERPEIDVVFGSLIAYTPGDSGASLNLYEKFRRRDFVQSGFLGQPAVFFRASLFQTSGGFDEDLKFVADCEFWMRVVDESRVARTDLPLAVELNHSETLRHTVAHEIQIELNKARGRHGRVDSRLVDATVAARRSFARRAMLVRVARQVDFPVALDRKMVAATMLPIAARTTASRVVPVNGRLLRLLRLPA